MNFFLCGSQKKKRDKQENANSWLFCSCLQHILWETVVFENQDSVCSSSDAAIHCLWWWTPPKSTVASECFLKKTLYEAKDVLQT